MIQRLFTAVFVLVTITCSAQTKKTVESTIRKVTVFLQGAQVERAAKVNVAAGKQEIVFEGISPAIDKQSLQVKTADNITIVSVIHQADHLHEQERQKEITDLQSSRDAMDEKIQTEKNTIAVYRQEETMLLKNQQVSGSNTGLKTADLKEAIDFQRLRLTEVYDKISAHEKLLKQLTASRLNMEKQLLALNQQTDNSTSSVHVTIISKTAAVAAFDLSYLVRKAGWYPTYDIRVKDIASPVNLQFKANVHQTSGEDWKDVRMSLSTGDPSVNNNIPAVDPWYLRYVYKETGLRIRGLATITADASSATTVGRVSDQSGNPISGATITVKGTSQATTTDANGYYSMPGVAGSTLVVASVGFEPREVAGGNVFNTIQLAESVNRLDEVIVVGYGTPGAGSEVYERPNIKKAKTNSTVETTTLYQPTTTVYDIADPYTVLNDGKTYTVEIDGFEVQARYEYYAAPKISSSAYLTAKILEWQDLNLLKGEANIFFEGTFLGQSLLDPSTAGDTLSISLGHDKGVAVQRKLLKEYSSKKFIGSNRTDTRRYEITVRNNKQLPVTITVQDQFPISTLKEIEVRDREYKGVSLDDDTQKVTWSLVVDAKKEQKQVLGYEVRYPKDRVLQLD